MIVRDVIVRKDYPAEPGVWVEIRRLAWREFPRMTAGADSIAELFAKAITAWAYADPVTPENIDRLDDDMAKWLLDEINRHNHPTVTEDDRKNAPSPSTAT